MCQVNTDKHLDNISESQAAKWAYRQAFVPLFGIFLYVIYSFIGMIHISYSKEGKTGLLPIKKGFIVFLLNILVSIPLYMYFVLPADTLMLNIIDPNRYYRNQYYSNYQREYTGKFDANGNKVGKWTYWYIDGRKKSEGEYDLQGKKTGKWTEWDEDGKFEGLYINDKEHGKWCGYKNGKILAEYNYLDGKLDGKRTHWFENGKKSSERIYKNGQRLHIIIWNENGQKEREGYFKDGLFKWKYWFENGKLKSEGKSIDTFDTKKEGKWIFYYDNGQKESEGEYIGRRRETGKWTYWDEQGNITKEEEYDNNGFFIKRVKYKDGKPAQ